MPQQVVKKTSFNFVGGLNTEAGYLTFPPNVWKEGDNVIPQLDGALHLRTSVNYEDGAVNSLTADTTTVKQLHAFGTFEWDSVKGDANLHYIVAQRGRYLFFYKSVAAATSTTELAAAFTIDLNTYKAPLYPSVVGVDPVQCSSAGGRLIVTSVATDPIVVEQLEGALSFTVTRLVLRYRDFEGDLLDTLVGESIDIEPATLTANHKYNLFNQGWRGVHADAYFAALGKYPSNAQQWFIGKNATDDFDPVLLNKQEFGKSRAPQGHFLLQAFNRDRATASGIAGLAVEEEKYRTGACAFFAGRAWFAGIQNSAKLGAWVFFSQIGRSIDKFANCYQDADPTSEHISDLVDSDGGVIPIHGIGHVDRMVPLGRALLVFADNGVWAISGTIDAGFSATGYEVTQLTTVGSVAARTVVPVEGQVVYWANEGIWTIGPTDVGGFVAKSLSDTTIATLYRNIAAYAKTNATGKYHASDKKVYWLYQNAPNADGVTDRFKVDRMLVLDTRLGALYTHSISPLASNSPFILDLFPTEHEPGVSSKLKFFTQIVSGSNWAYTWSEFEDGLNQPATFKDWFTANGVGVGYIGFILTGYDLGANQGGDRKLQVNYITTLMKRTETGIDAASAPINEASVKLSSRWNFADNSVSGKWSPPFEIYRHKRLFIPATVPSSTFEDGLPVVIAKSKIKGRGNAFQLKFEGAVGKDFKLIGWSVMVASNVS